MSETPFLVDSISIALVVMGISLLYTVGAVLIRYLTRTTEEGR